MKLKNKKTGEIKSIGEIISEAFLYNDLDSLKTIDANWEGYEPTEPLIKDEKIRRGLSEWIALYGEHEKIKYFRYNDSVVFRLCRERGTPEPEISLPVKYDCDSLREGKEYTKPELCGDEEKPRSVIADGVKYHSYEDYLRSKEEEDN